MKWLFSLFGWINSNVRNIDLDISDFSSVFIFRSGYMVINTHKDIDIRISYDSDYPIITLKTQNNSIRKLGEWEFISHKEILNDLIEHKEDVYFRDMSRSINIKYINNDERLRKAFNNVMDIINTYRSEKRGEIISKILGNE